MAADLPLADELAAVHARMARLLLTPETVHSALGLVTSVAKETLAHTAGAGVTLLDEFGRRVTAAATDPVVERADRLQYDLEDGPCLTAVERRSVQRIDDLEREQRWPRWCAAVRPLGMRATLSAPLMVRETALGAIKVYSDLPAAYGARAEHLISVFAAQAAVLLGNAQSFEQANRLSDELRDALGSRDQIGIAKGILMARHGVEEATAFVMLASAAQREGKTLRDTAQELIRSTGRRRA